MNDLSVQAFSRWLGRGPVAAFLGLALLTGCSKPTDPRVGPAVDAGPKLDGVRALAEVEALVALGLRDAGTEGAARAAGHILNRLTAIGVDAHIEEFLDETPSGPLSFRNVIGRLPGRGEGLLVIGSHFDTRRGIGDGFQGANDSGSSTGLLLELARVLAKGPVLGPEIWFAFFDGEESQISYGPKDGLHGSRKLAGDLVSAGRVPDVLAVLVLDMIGDRNLTVTMPRNVTPHLLSLVFDAARAEQVRNQFVLSSSSILDDHAPFLDRGLPALVWIDFEYGQRSGGNEYWHTPEDTVDKLSAESLDIVGRVALRTVRRLSGIP